MPTIPTCARMSNKKSAPAKNWQNFCCIRGGPALQSRTESDRGDSDGSEEITERDRTVRTQKQEFCRNCNKSTLHTREVAQVNNLLFFFFTVFTCSLFLPIWILALMTRKKYPWLCSTCGHRLGRRSERERNEKLSAQARQRAERAERKQAARDQRQARRDDPERLAAGEAKRKQKQTDRAEREAARTDPDALAAAAATKQQRQEALAAAGGTIVAQFRQALGAADSALKTLAGDDQFMHNFFRVLLVGSMLLIGTIAATIVWNIVF